MKPFKTAIRQLPCELTDLELRRFGDELAVAVQDTTAEEDRQKQIKTEMKARIDELTARKARIALTISRREEYRDTEVRYCLDGNGMVLEVRADTGEVLRTRPLADEERQLVLDSPASEVRGER